MYIFDYRNNVLCAESVPLDQMAAEVGTPFYCYSSERLKQNYREFANAFSGMKASIHYAIKANASQAVIRTLAECGAGAETNSAGEMERALQAGVKPDKIIFGGVGKTKDEIAAALLGRIYQINVESVSELEMISQIALSMERPAPIALRVNPEIDARALKKNQTGYKETKFGIEMEHMAEALMLASALPGLDLKGLMVHVDSHVYDYAPFRQAYQMIADTFRICRGQGLKLERVDLGGGVGIPYDGQNQAPFAEYAAMVKEVIGPLDCEILFEPGRKLVGDAGVLVSRIVHMKKTPTKNFVVIDAGMNDLVRPALYGARHGLLPVKENKGISVMPVTVVGPVSEPGDMFGENYFLPPPELGDFVAILQAGAYGSAMSSAYNGRPLIPEVMVSGAQYAVIRRRVAISEQMAWESMPTWIDTQKT